LVGRTSNAPPEIRFGKGAFRTQVDLCNTARWKAVIESKLKARSFENQKTEAKIGVRILNRMTELGRPKFERTA
jgi:hypothetical protein